MTEVNRDQIVAEVAAQVDQPKTVVADVFNAIFTAVKSHITAGETVSVYGFGKFDTIVTKERQGHNPKTLEKVLIPAKRKPRFSASSTLKAALN